MRTSSPIILIIDDENKLVFGLKALLQREGYTVYTASNGSQGLQYIKQYQPNLIICDVMMPPPNGFALKKILLEDKRLAAIPFIFSTARTGGADIIAGLNLGADDYVTKPFNIEELLARVRAVLRRSNALR